MAIIQVRTHPEIFRTYEDSYAEEPNRFPISSGAETFAREAISHVVNRMSLNILELGCGQGNYLAFIRDLLRETRPVQLPPAHMTGVDGAITAIKQCEERYPDLNWACDRHQELIAEHDIIVGGRRYDLIVDKGGTTKVSTVDEARELQTGIKQLLKPDGIYGYVISRSFYDPIARPVIYKGWNTDWLSLALDAWTFTFNTRALGHYGFLFSDEPFSATR